MISLTQIILGLIIFGLIAIFVVSGKARALGKAIINLFVEDMAATPEGAEALFRQKEEQVEDSFRKADNVYKKIAGQLTRNQEELNELNSRLPKIETQCEKLAKKGDREGLTIKAAERSDILEEIENHNHVIDELQKALTSAAQARKACEDNLAQVKKQHKKTISDMKRNTQMKEVYDDLEGIGADTPTSRMLDRVIEKSQEMDDLVEGSRQAYESRTSTRVKRLNERIRSSEADEYADALIAKYQTPLLEDKGQGFGRDPFFEELEKRRKKDNV